MRTTIEDTIKLGADVAGIKAGMSKKKWRKLVKVAHARGFTIRGQLQDVPDPLKERTRSSIVKQAQSTVAASYKPVLSELSARERAIREVDSKQATDEAAFRTWLSGQSDVIDAQARAADATLASQQQQIATDNHTAWAAATADSAQRASATPGNVSNPGQSKALDFSAAEKNSNDMVANSRELTSQLTASADKSRGTSRAAMVATAAAQQAQRMAATWNALGSVAQDKNKAIFQQAADAANMVNDLLGKEVTKAEYNTDTGIAAGKLGVEQAKLSQSVKDSNRKARLENRRLDIEQFKADNTNAYNDAKVQIGYDKIKSTEGQKAADRAMRQWIAKYNATHRAKGKNGTNGPTASEQSNTRKAYQTVETVRHAITRWHNQGKDASKLRQHLINMGYDNVTIDVANDLWRNNGTLSANGVSKARRLGVPHPRQFWG